MFQSSQDLLILSNENNVVLYNKRTQEKLAEYKHTGKAAEPVAKKAKPCESRVDNLNVIQFDLKTAPNSESAKIVVVYNDKTAKYLNFSNNKLTVINEWSLQKRPTAVKIIESEGYTDMVVVDKTGDAYRLLSSNENLACSTETPVVGHISMLLDVVLTDKYLITAERDEKIKVSIRKRPVDIHGYLLGHTQFVKSIFEVGGLLVSFGGDYEAKLWDLESCEELDSYTLPNNTLHVFQSASNASHFTVITREGTMHQFSLNATSKQLESSEIKDELTSSLFSGEFQGVPSSFMTGKQDCENFDKLFKTSEFTKY